MKTAYELRRHLAADHDVHISGADYGTLITIHTVEHRPGTTLGHHHEDGPDSDEWRRDCSEFGCAEEAH